MKASKSVGPLQSAKCALVVLTCRHDRLRNMAETKGRDASRNNVVVKVRLFTLVTSLPGPGLVLEHVFGASDY